MSLVIKSSLRLIGLSVLVTGLLGLALSVAQPYTVCPSGCPFAKIQAALDAAKDGDTITVGPGVYKENLKITKSVSLVGADPAQVRLMPGGPAYALIQVGDEPTLGTVRIEGFTLQQAAGLVEQAVYTDVDSSIQGFVFRNNRVLNREEKDWIASLVGDAVTVEKSIFSANSTLKIDGRRIHVFNNDLRLVEIDPFLGDTGNEALVEGNTFREEEVFVAGNAIVRKNQFRSAGLGIGVGGNPLEVELVQVLENEFLGPGVSSFPPTSWSSIAIGVGTTSDRVLIEGNKIANYDVGIGIDRWTSLSLDIIIRRNTISQGWYGIWLKAQRQEPTKIQILGNTIDRQQHPKGSDSSGAGILIDGEVEQVEVLMQGNTIRLGDFGVLLMPGSGKFEFQGNKIIDNDLFGVLL
ncbi:MAG: right-handed parallel beta-helix repeat-containing protein, partial [Candidatus Caldarchaeum sp.]